MILAKKKLSTKPPEFLSEDAANIYKKVVKILNEQGNVINFDRDLVVRYATTYELYLAAYAEVVDHGIQVGIYDVKQTSKGKVLNPQFKGYQRNPAIQTYNEQMKNLATIASELGLTPKSRAELSQLIEDDEPVSLDDIDKEGDSSF